MEKTDAKRLLWTFRCGPLRFSAARAVRGAFDFRIIILSLPPFDDVFWPRSLWLRSNQGLYLVFHRRTQHEPDLIPASFSLERRNHVQESEACLRYATICFLTDSILFVLQRRMSLPSSRSSGASTEIHPVAWSDPQHDLEKPRMTRTMTMRRSMSTRKAMK